MDDEALTAAIREVQQRARTRSNGKSLGLDGVTAPDLMPLVHARDAAEAKVAAIGRVNPRPAGVVHSIAQGFKKIISRALDWHVREQVEFNRGVMACVQSTLEALTEVNRTLAGLATHHRELRDELELKDAEYHRIFDEHRRMVDGYHREADELKDIRKHWTEWRASFEDRRSAAEIHMLRTISELQAAFQHRVTLLEDSFRKTMVQQHGEFLGDVDRKVDLVQKQLWKDMQQVRGEYEKLIFAELKSLRQKQLAVSASPAAISEHAAEDIPIDWMHFGARFRGSEERVRERQQMYVDRFAGTSGEILDIGCGRGEFLEAALEAKLEARGIDLSEESVAYCRAKGLAAERADLFTYLDSLPDRSLAGAYCSQVIEHLPPERLPVLVRLLGTKLHTGATVAFETPNPECLAIFATHFYIDPTHTRPVPPVLLHFYLEEAGFGNIEVQRLEPAVESIPALTELPASVRDSLFGCLDYAMFGKKF